MNTVTERVVAGAKFLDEHMPGWEKRVNLDELEMSSECLCILGQQNGSYGQVAESLGLDPDGKQATDLGFLESTLGDVNANLHAVLAEYHALDDAWHDLITARREPVSVEGHEVG